MSIRIQSLAAAGANHVDTNTKYPGLIFKGTFNPSAAGSIPPYAGNGYFIASTAGTLEGTSYNLNDWLISIDGVHSKFPYSELIPLGYFSPNSPRYVSQELPLAVDSTVNDKYIASKTGILDGVSYVKLDTVVSSGTEWILVPTHNSPNEQAIPLPTFTYNAMAYEGFYLEAGEMGYLKKVKYNVGDYAVAVAGKWYKVTVGTLVSRGGFTPSSGYSNDLYIDIPITTNDYYKATVAGTLDGFSYSVNDTIVRLPTGWSPLSLSKGSAGTMVAHLDFTFPGSPTSNAYLNTYEAPSDGRLLTAPISTGQHAVQVSDADGVRSWFIFNPSTAYNMGNFSPVEIGSTAKYVGLGYNVWDYVECGTNGTLDGLDYRSGDILFYLGPNILRTEDWVRVPLSQTSLSFDMYVTYLLSTPGPKPGPLWRVPHDGILNGTAYSAGDLIYKTGMVRIPGGVFNYQGDLEYKYVYAWNGKGWGLYYSGTENMAVASGSGSFNGGSKGDWYSISGTTGYADQIFINLDGTSYKNVTCKGQDPNGWGVADLIVTAKLDYPAGSYSGRYGITQESGLLDGVLYQVGDIALYESGTWVYVAYSNGTGKGLFNPNYLEQCRVANKYIPIGASDWDLFDVSVTGSCLGMSLKGGAVGDSVLFLDAFKKWIKIPGTVETMRGSRRFFYAATDYANRYLTAGESSVLEGVTYATGDYAMSVNGVWNKITPSTLVSKGAFSPIDVANASTLPTINIGATELNTYIASGAGYLNGQAYVTGDRATFNNGRWVRVPDPDHRALIMRNPVIKLDYVATDYANGYMRIAEAGLLDGVMYQVGDLAVSIAGKWVRVQPSLYIDKGTFDPTIPRRLLLGLPNPHSIVNKGYYVATEDGISLGVTYLQGDIVYVENGTYYRLNTSTASRVFSDRVNPIYDISPVSMDGIETAVSRYYPRRFSFSTGYIKPPLVYGCILESASVAESQLNSTVRPVKLGVHDILGRPFRLVGMRADTPSQGAMVIKDESTRMITGGLWGISSEDGLKPINAPITPGLCTYTYKDKYQAKLVKIPLDIYTGDISAVSYIKHDTNNIAGFRTPRAKMADLSEGATLATLPVVTLDLRYCHYHDKLSSVMSDLYSTVSAKRDLYIARGFKNLVADTQGSHHAITSSTRRGPITNRIKVTSNSVVMETTIPPLPSATIEKERYKQVIETLVYVDGSYYSSQLSIVDRLKHTLKFSRGKVEAALPDELYQVSLGKRVLYRYISSSRDVYSPDSGVHAAGAMSIHGGVGTGGRYRVRQIPIGAVEDATIQTLAARGKPWVNHLYRDLFIGSLALYGAMSVGDRRRIRNSEILPVRDKLSVSNTASDASASLTQASRLVSTGYRYRTPTASSSAAAESISTSGRVRQTPAVALTVRNSKVSGISMMPSVAMLVRSAKIFNFKGLVVAEPQVSAVSTLTSLSAFLRSWSGNSALDIATVDANRPPANVTVSPAIGVCKYRTAEVRAIKDTAIVSPATPTLHKGRIWAARGVEAAVPQVGIVVAVTTPNISRFKIRYTVVNAITSLDTVATADIGRHEAGYKVSKYGISSLVEDIAVITTINPTRFTGISTPRGVVSGDIDGVSADTITFRVPSLPPRTIAVRPLSVTSVTDDGMTSCTGDVVRYGTGRVRGWCYGYDIGDAATVDTVQTHKSWISHIASFDTDMMLETVSAGEVELEIKGKRWVPHIAKFDTDMMLETVSADTTQDATRSQGLHRVRYRAWEFDISTTKDDTATEAARERQRILYAATFYLPYSDDSYEFWS